MQYKELIVAITALVIGMGSIFKPADTTAAEKTYTFTGAQIEALATEQRALQADVANLRGYLDGLEHAHDEDDEVEADEGEAEDPRGWVTPASLAAFNELNRATLKAKPVASRLTKLRSKPRKLQQHSFDQMLQQDRPPQDHLYDPLAE